MTSSSADESQNHPEKTQTQNIQQIVTTTGLKNIAKISLLRRFTWLTIHHLDDARDIWLAVKARFGGNEESKNMRKSMLKQEFQEFRVSENEAPSHSAFVSTTSGNNKKSYAETSKQSSSYISASPGSNVSYFNSGNVMEDIKELEQDKLADPKALLFVDSMVNWSDHEESADENASQVYGMIAGRDDEDEVAGDFALMGVTSQTFEKRLRSCRLASILLARFDKWKETSKNLAKLVDSSMSVKSRLGLGYRDYIGEDEVYYPTMPSIFDSTLEEVDGKPNPVSDKSSVPRQMTLLYWIQVTSHLHPCLMGVYSVQRESRPMWNNVDNIPPFIPQAAHGRSGNVTFPAGSVNMPAPIPAGRQTGPAPVYAGTPVPAEETLKRAGEALEPDTSKKQKSTEAPIPSVPDVPQPPVVSSPKSSGTRRKSLGRNRLTKPKSILKELDLDADDKTFIKVVSDEDSTDEAPILWSALAGWEVISTPLGEINALYRSDQSTKHFTTLREILHMVDRQDLLKLYGMVVTYYENHLVAGAGLMLWGDLQVLIDSQEGGKGSFVWNHQSLWQIRSWRLYTLSNVHVLETVSGEVLYMFADVSYPLSVKLMERMLKHKLEIDKDVVGNDMTTAEQLIRFIKNQIAAAQVSPV
ncbi:hypothetical protein Tco_0272831 [Tanacetum coccineum]